MLAELGLPDVVARQTTTRVAPGHQRYRHAAEAEADPGWAAVGDPPVRSFGFGERSVGLALGRAADEAPDGVEFGRCRLESDFRDDPVGGGADFSTGSVDRAHGFEGCDIRVHTAILALAKVDTDAAG